MGAYDVVDLSTLPVRRVPPVSLTIMCEYEIYIRSASFAQRPVICSGSSGERAPYTLILKAAVSPSLPCEM
jgi:hypothetical protein